MALPNPKTSPATAPGGTGSTNLLFWPLVIVIEDCFVPQSAQLVVDVVREMDTEAVGAQLQLEAAIAELFTNKN